MTKKAPTNTELSIPIEDVRLLLECVEDEHGGDHTDADCRHCAAVNRIIERIENTPANTRI